MAKLKLTSPRPQTLASQNLEVRNQQQLFELIGSYYELIYGEEPKMSFIGTVNGKLILEVRITTKSVKELYAVEFATETRSA